MSFCVSSFSSPLGPGAESHLFPVGLRHTESNPGTHPHWCTLFLCIPSLVPHLLHLWTACWMCAGIVEYGILNYIVEAGMRFSYCLPSECSWNLGPVHLPSLPLTPHYIPNPAVRDLWGQKANVVTWPLHCAIPPALLSAACMHWYLSCPQTCVCVTTLVLPSVLSLSAPLCLILLRSAHTPCLWPEQPCPSSLQYSSRHCLITYRILFQLQFPVLAWSSDEKHWLSEWWSGQSPQFPYANESCFPFPELWTWAESPRMTIWCGHCGMPFIPGSFTDYLLCTGRTGMK